MFTASSPETQTTPVEMHELAPYDQAPRLVEARPESRGVVLTWRDGAESRPPWVWLRDHCACSECRHPQTRERLVLPCARRVRTPFACWQSPRRLSLPRRDTRYPRARADPALRCPGARGGSPIQQLDPRNHATATRNHRGLVYRLPTFLGAASSTTSQDRVRSGARPDGRLRQPPHTARPRCLQPCQRTPPPAGDLSRPLHARVAPAGTGASALRHDTNGRSLADQQSH
ncbi:hypothetical protein HALO32_01147 [Halomonas lysinitropha]|uniref:Gamma-butyrobetaine hydroxylase-like N-terminal domain-containing protein n=1 Tax=Halomonas lysinitropha TaxID=2607506 RepID=A0A5K1I7M6_9GAMM|nr:hypothetical protein HALO32_01147 [Halomonas lysinitropha]